jgi:hypothetical protein
MTQVHASRDGRNAPYVRRDRDARSASEESDAWQREEERDKLERAFRRARRNGGDL